jgi:hypothetical protein
VAANAATAAVVLDADVLAAIDRAAPGPVP